MSDVVRPVYTDGACRGNPGPGGWAWIVPDGPWANGADADTTNQRMELTAVLDAVQSLEGRIEVVSDSTYVVNCFRDKWYEGWQKRGWKNSKKEPVANRDLWEPLVEAYRARQHEITFMWVKGHAGNEWNDVADRLAVEAAAHQHSRRGVGIPEDLGPPDDFNDEQSQGDPLPGSDGKFNSAWRPTGRSVVVLGVQPPQLGGYGENDVAADVRRQLQEILHAKHQLDPDLVVLTGLRLGAETLGAEAAKAASVPYVAVLPYPDPDGKWPKETRKHFAGLLGAARAVVQLERKVPESAQRAGQALGRRNGWLRKVADEAVIVWDGNEPRTKQTIADFERDFDAEVWVVRTG